MTTLSRWYNINVFYANQALKTYHFTGDLERYGDFRKTLSMIEKATSIRFKINGNNITVEEILINKKGDICPIPINNQFINTQFRNRLI